MTIQAGQTATAADMLKSHKSDGMLEFDVPTTLTIASGVITVTQNFHMVDTEGAAASDNLDTINGGTDGFVLVIRPANDARTVYITHNVGNIKVFGDSTIALDDAHDCAILIYSADLAKWIAISGKNYDGHIQLSANVHGLPASVNAFGNRDGAGRFMQSGQNYITGDGATDTATKAITFPVAFSSLLVVIVSGAKLSYNLDTRINFASANESTTGFTAYAQNWAGPISAINYGFCWIAIGT